MHIQGLFDSKVLVKLSHLSCASPPPRHEYRHFARLSPTLKSNFWRTLYIMRTWVRWGLHDPNTPHSVDEPRGHHIPQRYLLTESWPWFSLPSLGCWVCQKCWFWWSWSGWTCSVEGRQAMLGDIPRQPQHTAALQYRGSTTGSLDAQTNVGHCAD